MDWARRSTCHITSTDFRFDAKRQHCISLHCVRRLPIWTTHQQKRALYSGSAHDALCQFSHSRQSAGRRSCSARIFSMQCVLAELEIPKIRYDFWHNLATSTSVGSRQVSARRPHRCVLRSGNSFHLATVLQRHILLLRKTVMSMA